MTRRARDLAGVALASCATVLSVLGLVLHWPLLAYEPPVLVLVVAAVTLSLRRRRT